MTLCAAAASKRTVSDDATLSRFLHPTFCELSGTIGYGPETGLPREAIFSGRVRSGTIPDGPLYDAGLLLSLMSLMSLTLQYGTPATALIKFISHLEDGSAASPVGEWINAAIG